MPPGILPRSAAGPDRRRAARRVLEGRRRGRAAGPAPAGTPAAPAAHECRTGRRGPYPSADPGVIAPCRGAARAPPGACPVARSCPVGRGRTAGRDAGGGGGAIGGDRGRSGTGRPQKRRRTPEETDGSPVCPVKYQLSLETAPSAPASRIRKESPKKTKSIKYIYKDVNLAVRITIAARTPRGDQK